MTGVLTTHVLDTTRGIPASDLQIQLWRISEPGTSREERALLLTVFTNQNGRTDEPLMRGETFKTGVYELHFAVGAYFARSQGDLPQPPFLDLVPVRFGIARADAHYHVPLLVSPWAYSTYRGS